MNRQQWKRLTYVVLAGALALGVAQTARSAAKEGPTAEDARGAGRTVVAHAAADDERAALPSGGRIGAPGTVEPRDREARLTTQVPGVVAELLVVEGDRVAAGAPLVRLHADVERAAVAAATADVAAAKAQLAKVVRGARAEDLRDAEAQADAAGARAQQAARDAERVGALAERGAAAPEEVDQARSQAAIDARNAAAADARFRALANGSRREDVALARAQLEQAEARLEQARAALARMTLVAPVAGQVLEVLVRPGEYVNPGAANAAITLGDTSKVRVRLQVDERDVGRVATGQMGYVVADAYGDRRFVGKVVDVGRRMGKKKLVTDEPGEKLDVQILDVTLELDGQPPLVQGLRVTGYLEADRDQS